MYFLLAFSFFAFFLNSFFFHCILKCNRNRTKDGNLHLSFVFFNLSLKCKHFLSCLRTLCEQCVSQLIYPCDPDVPVLAWHLLAASAFGWRTLSSSERKLQFPLFPSSTSCFFFFLFFSITILACSLVEHLKSQQQIRAVEAQRTERKVAPDMR